MATGLHHFPTPSPGRLLGAALDVALLLTGPRARICPVDLFKETRQTKETNEGKPDECEVENKYFSRW